MCVGPTVAAWIYFVELDGRSSARVVYALAKAAQFALPLLLLLWLRPRRPAITRSGPRSLGLGLATGAALSAAIAPLPLLLGALDLRAAVSVRIAEKMADFGISGAARFVLLALGLSVVHSALEEYYWRWSVLGALRHRMGDVSAALLSSLAFAAHHVVVLTQLTTTAELGTPAWLVVLSATAVALAGLVWCALYLWTGRLLASWISHVLVDLALFGVGARLIWAG
jgi:membrane protease YdiL (CAAX protease family)